MAKMTLLEIVQDILSDMTSDEINSINDTLEALQVAQIVKSTFSDIITNGTWPHLRRLGQLEATNATTPTYMKMPEAVQKIEDIRYNKRTSTDTEDRYLKVTFKEIDDFLNLVMSRKESEDNVDKIVDVGTNVPLYIFNDTAPSFWTSFDDEYIVFDSYDNQVDSFLQVSKNTLLMWVDPVFVISDDYIPDLPAKAFSYLLQESKSMCFSLIAQEDNIKVEGRALNQRRRLSNDRFRAEGGIPFRKYGRNA